MQSRPYDREPLALPHWDCDIPGDVRPVLPLPLLREAARPPLVLPPESPNLDLVAAARLLPARRSAAIAEVAVARTAGCRLAAPVPTGEEMDRDPVPVRPIVPLRLATGDALSSENMWSTNSLKSTRPLRSVSIWSNSDRNSLSDMSGCTQVRNTLSSSRSNVPFPSVSKRINCDLSLSALAWSSWRLAGRPGVVGGVVLPARAADGAPPPLRDAALGVTLLRPATGEAAPPRGTLAGEGALRPPPPPPPLPLTSGAARVRDGADRP